LIVIQRQLRHSNLGIASISLQAVDYAEIIVMGARPPSPDGSGQPLAAPLIFEAPEQATPSLARPAIPPR
jgi:hypothetical protein